MPSNRSFLRSLSNIGRCLAAALVTCAIVTSSVVHADVTQEVLRCGAIKSNDNRLICFDWIARQIGSDIATEDINSDESSTTTDRDQFGEEGFKPEHNAGPPSITGTITGVEKLALGNYLLMLEDGQIWREVEADRRARYSVGDTVVIKRGFLETYDLVSNATGRRTKVKRVK